jgi:hypothetical protein
MCGLWVHENRKAAGFRPCCAVAAWRISLAEHRSAEPAVPAACVRQDNLWRITWRLRGVLVEHSVGMAHLSVLLANPGTEVEALDLGTTAAPAQPTADGAAMREYRQRLSDLRAEIDRVEAKDELARADAARAERARLIAEVVGGKGFYGRAGHCSDSGKGARMAVGDAIRRAVAEIATADAVIGAHLDHTVHTGVRCCYRPA